MAYYHNGEVTLDINQECIFLTLPVDVQINILTRLSTSDIWSFRNTCRKAVELTQDPYLWKTSLWVRHKALNITDENARKSLPNRQPRILMDDPYCRDPRRLAVVLDACLPLNKKTKPKISKLITDIWPDVRSTTTADLRVFRLGREAPQLMLLGPWDTPLTKQLHYHLMASQQESFSPVGLVRGRPGGVGSGITVEWQGEPLNLLPIRKTRVRSFVQKRQGIRFVAAMADLGGTVDGIVYSVDMRCVCAKIRNGTAPLDNLVAMEKHLCRDNGAVLSRVDCFVSHQGISQHYTHLDMLELNVLLSTMTSRIPPVLIFALDKGSATGCHTPKDLYPCLKDISAPWMIMPVSLPDDHNIHVGLQWLLKVTRNKSKLP